MRPDLDAKLFEAFPILYKQHNLSCQETCMCWGFECPDDWYPVIYELSERITTYMVENEFEVQVAQVKEKFGSLRFYIDIMSDISEKDINVIYSFIDEAAEKVDSLK